MKDDRTTCTLNTASCKCAKIGAMLCQQILTSDFAFDRFVNKSIPAVICLSPQELKCQFGKVVHKYSNHYFTNEQT